MLQRHAGLLALLAFFSTAALAAIETRPLKVDKLEFLAPANVKTFNVRGQAESLEGKATYDGAKVTAVELSVPVEKLSTGMALRDRHMKERVFATKDGKTPPVVFKAASLDCPAEGAGKCEVPGTLSIRGTEKPQKFTVERDGKSFKGTTTVKLSDYDIPPPSQLGVKVQNEVTVSFQGKVE